MHDPLLQKLAVTNPDITFFRNAASPEFRTAAAGAALSASADTALSDDATVSDGTVIPDDADAAAVISGTAHEKTASDLLTDAPLPPHHTAGLNFLTGTYHLYALCADFGKSFFPSPFARGALLHLQLLASGAFDSRHYTRRRDLPSYLMAQTYFGRGVLRYEGREYALTPDDVFLIDCRRAHEYFAAAPAGWGYRMIHFDGSAMPGLFARILACGSVVFRFGAESRFQALLAELYATCAAAPPQEEVLCHRLLTDLLCELLCRLPAYRPQDYPEAIKKQCSFLQEHCREKWSLDALAAVFCLSKHHLCREFKRHTGRTLFTYLTECRMNLALRLLRSSELPVGEIATFVGFDDHNAFYRTFRQREGMSPSAYRKNWRGFSGQ